MKTLFSLFLLAALPVFADVELNLPSTTVAPPRTPSGPLNTSAEIPTGPVPLRVAPTSTTPPPPAGSSSPAGNSSYEAGGGTQNAAYTAAASAASHFINLIDQGQYAASWLDAGSLLQDVISQREWVAAMTVLRKPLGSVYARKTNGYKTSQTLPRGTRGNFIIINYQTNFTTKSMAIETVSLMSMPYDQWKVVSYAVL